MYETCIICLDEIKGDVAKKKYFTCDCYLNFHNECIKKWMIRTNTCPICRSVMEYEDECAFKVRLVIVSFIAVLFLITMCLAVIGIRYVKIRDNVVK